MGRTATTAITLLLGLLTVACGADELLPIARFSVDPPWLCEHDVDRSVLFNGRASRSADGTSSDGLTYAWQLTPAPLEILSGGLADRRLAARFAADRPVQVELRVSDDAGRTGTSTRTLGLTLVRTFPCDQGRGCELHEICVPVGGVDICVDDLTCTDDDDCGCLRCADDDTGARRCIP